MPDLIFTIISAKVKPFTAVPTLSFQLQIVNTEEEEEVYAAALRCQVLIEATKRAYADHTKEELVELFGEPERWEETVKGLYWMTITLPIPRFNETTIVEVPLPCFEDHISAAGKYFYAVRDGFVPLAFLFSGTLFYRTKDGELQISQVPWHKEAAFKMPASLWNEMMTTYFPHKRWLSIPIRTFEKLFRLKSKGSFASMDDCLDATIEQALLEQEFKT